MLKKIFLSLITLGIYPIVSKSRKGKLTKVTKKYRDDGTLRKDVTLDFEYDDGSSPQPPEID